MIMKEHWSQYKCSYYITLWYLCFNVSRHITYKTQDAIYKTPIILKMPCHPGTYLEDRIGGELTLISVRKALHRHFSSYESLTHTDACHGSHLSQVFLYCTAIKQPGQKLFLGLAHFSVPLRTGSLDNYCMITAQHIYIFCQNHAKFVMQASLILQLNYLYNRVKCKVSLQ